MITVPDTAKQRILECAKQLFAEQGYDKASIRVLAEKAQVSHGLIRHHFGSKEQVWYAVADTLMGNMSEETSSFYQLLINNFQPNQSAYLMINDFIDNLDRDPLIIKLIIQFSSAEQKHFDYFIRQYLAIRKDLRSLIEQSCQQGFIEDINASEIMVMLIGMISMPTALPQLFSANFEHTGAPEELRHHYFASVKSVFGNVLKVDVEDTLNRLQQLSA